MAETHLAITHNTKGEVFRELNFRLMRCAAPHTDRRRNNRKNRNARTAPSIDSAIPRQ